MRCSWTDRRRQTDKQRKWHQDWYQKKSLQQINSVVCDDDIITLLDTNATCTESMHKHIENISSMDVAEFPLVIKEAAREENVLVQTTVLNVCLWQMFHCLNTESDFQKSQSEQVRVLCQLIFKKENTLLITHTEFEKSFIFHSFFVLTDKMTFQIVSLTKLDDE